jgi:hypothetical protein
VHLCEPSETQPLASKQLQEETNKDAIDLTIGPLDDVTVIFCQHLGELIEELWDSV